MTAILITGGLVAALLLVSLLRVGGTAEYSQTGLLVRVRLGPVRLTVYPARAKKAGKKQKKSVSDAPEESVKSGGSFAQFKRFLPLITDAAGRLKHKIRVDTLNLDFTAASQNPAAAALEFGYANAAIGMLFPLLEHNFNIKDRRVRTAVDFNAKQPVIHLLAAFSMTVGQGVALGLRLLLQFIKQSSAQREKQKEAV